MLWDWEREEVVRTIDAGPGVLAFDPGGARLAVARGEVADIFDVATGAQLASILGHASSTLDVAFSPDGSRIATSGIDGTIRLYDTETGDNAVVLHGHCGFVAAIEFSEDGRRLVSLGGTSSDAGPIFEVRVWALDLDELLEIARQELTRSMLDEESRQYLHLEGCPG